MKPETRSERFLHDDKRTVDLVVHVDPGPRYAFGRLDVQGLDIHAEAAIRKLWAGKPGDPFDSAYPDFFLQRIKDDGVFDNLSGAKSVLAPNDANLTVDVTLMFK
jgi:outer membrane translocation and assembly module TamA